MAIKELAPVSGFASSRQTGKTGNIKKKFDMLIYSYCAQ